MFVIFDLDGTLALNEHRVHYIRCERPNYAAFFSSCPNDEPCPPIIELLTLYVSSIDPKYRVEIWSGRSDEVARETREWLTKYGIDPELLTRMRRVGDYTPDHVLKRIWLEEEVARGTPPELVFDDRDKVVAMWREAGIQCCQVAPGPF